MWRRLIYSSSTNHHQVPRYGGRATLNAVSFLQLLWGGSRAVELKDEYTRGPVWAESGRRSPTTQRLIRCTNSTHGGGALSPTSYPGPGQPAVASGPPGYEAACSGEVRVRPLGGDPKPGSVCRAPGSLARAGYPGPGSSVVRPGSVGRASIQPPQS